MNWNWQQSDWPHFRWATERLARAEEQFLMGSGVVAGAVRHLAADDREQLVVESMGEGAVTSSEIEGEVLRRDSVQSSIRRELGLATDRRAATPAERGSAEMMVDLYRDVTRSLGHGTLGAWHEMVMRGRDDLDRIGGYRTHDDPMQIVSGPLDRPREVIFEAPPSSRVQAEMERFLDWFNGTAPGSAEALPAITRAGAAHLYFESIHPFEDGNGRIGRAISEMALAQAQESGTPAALSPAILARRAAYYDALEAGTSSNDITDWLAWFAGVALEAQERTRARVDFLIDRSRLLDRVRDDLNERQLKALLRVLRDGPDGFEGGLSARNYRTITQATTATTTRDLADMVAKGALRRTGERRHTRYHLPFSIRPAASVTIDDSGRLVRG